MIVLAHTFDGGTLVDGTNRGDGAGPLLKQHGFRWSRNLGQWFLPHSREKVARRGVVESTAEELRAGGFEVAVSIDNEITSSMEDRERARADRSEQRRAGLMLKAQREAAKAEEAYGRFRAELDPIPPGQPILVGHHSERGHRAALARADRAIARSAEADRERQEAERRAHAASVEQRRRHSPVFIGNRIKDRETELRDLQRKLAGTSTNGRAYGQRAEGAYRAQLEARMAACRDELAFWRESWTRLEEAGAVQTFTREQIKPGDFVRVRHGWQEVKRANRTTVSVLTGMFEGHTLKYGYHEVRGHRAKAPATDGRAGNEGPGGDTTGCPHAAPEAPDASDSQGRLAFDA